MSNYTDNYIIIHINVYIYTMDVCLKQVIDNHVHEGSDFGACTRRRSTPASLSTSQCSLGASMCMWTLLMCMDRVSGKLAQRWTKTHAPLC